MFEKRGRISRWFIHISHNGDKRNLVGAIFIFLSTHQIKTSGMFKFTFTRIQIHVEIGHQCAIFLIDDFKCFYVFVPNRDIHRLKRNTEQTSKQIQHPLCHILRREIFLDFFWVQFQMFFFVLRSPISAFIRIQSTALTALFLIFISNQIFIFRLSHGF